MTSVRRFYGDYLDVKGNNLLMNALGQGSQEKVLFSYKGKVVVHPGLLKKKKMSPRTIIITENSIYLIMYTKQKGEIVTKLDKGYPIQNINLISFSPMGDDIILLHSEELGDVVIECPLKTEMLAWIVHKNKALETNIHFEDKIKYTVKKAKQKISFIESSDPEHVEGLYKSSGKYYIPPGLPPDSRPTELTRKEGGETILSNRPLPSTQGPPKNTGGPRGNPNTGGGPRGTAPPNRALPPRNEPPKVEPPKSKGPQCKALYNYTAQEGDELTLRKGDIITIIKEHPDWWEGEINGKVGVFPANYVQKIDE